MTGFSIQIQGQPTRRQEATPLRDYAWRPLCRIRDGITDDMEKAIAMVRAWVRGKRWFKYYGQRYAVKGIGRNMDPASVVVTKAQISPLSRGRYAVDYEDFVL